MITRDLRHSIARAASAAGFDGAVDPGLRPAGSPGRYAVSIALALGGRPREIAGTLAAALRAEPYVDRAEVTGPGYLTVTVTPAALAAVAAAVAAAGPDCVASDALAGRTVAAPPPGDPLDAPGWEEARAALAARLTARLAAAAGATVKQNTSQREERTLAIPVPPPPSPRRAGHDGAAADAQPAADASPAGAAAFAGRDAVTLTLARAIPGKPLRVDPVIIARQVFGNPAYAVRYAHARASSEVRWEATAGETRSSTGGGPGGLLLLDTLSWLPERVVTAARRGRPDEFARYLEDLAAVTVDVLSSARHPGSAAVPGSDRLTLAMAARAGFAAGLGLLGVQAPDRL